MASSVGSMTVEDFLNAQCERLMARIDEHALGLQRKLRAEMEQGQREIEAMLAAKDGGGGPSAPAEGTKLLNVILQGTEGPYRGLAMELQTSKRDVLIGRSAARKFTETQCSVGKDREASTTHGKFEARRGKCFYTDMGSTNGSVIDGKELDKHTTSELKSGSVLRIGSSQWTVQLVEPTPSVQGAAAAAGWNVY